VRAARTLEHAKRQAEQDQIGRQHEDRDPEQPQVRGHDQVGRHHKIRDPEQPALHDFPLFLSILAEFSCRDPE
jgi:hypothetical protein